MRIRYGWELALAALLVDEDAVAFHKTTPHYKTCVAKLEALMTWPRKKRLFNGVMP